MRKLGPKRSSPLLKVMQLEWNGARIWTQDVPSEVLARPLCSYKSSDSGFTSLKTKHVSFSFEGNSVVSKYRPGFPEGLHSPTVKRNLQVHRTAVGIPFSRFSDLGIQTCQSELNTQDWPLTVRWGQSFLNSTENLPGMHGSRKASSYIFPLMSSDNSTLASSLQGILIQRNQGVCRHPSKQYSPQPVPKAWLSASQGYGDFCSAQIGLLGLFFPPFYLVSAQPLSSQWHKYWLNPIKLFTRNAWGDSKLASVRKSVI